MRTVNNLIRLNLIMILCLLTTDLYAQPKVRISLYNPPPGSFSAGDLWKMTLNNLTGSPLQIFLEGYADNQTTNQRIVSGISPAINLPPGTSNYNYRSFESGTVTWFDTTIQNFISRTGTVPAGIYKTCVTAKSIDSGNIIGVENCVYPNVTGNPALQITLISPQNGDSIRNQNMTFNWAGGILSGGSTYKLKIVQITGNQSPVIAFETNRAFFEKEDLRIPSFQYPISGSKFLNGKKYAWGVTTESGHSEVSFFIFPGNNNIISNNFIDLPDTSWKQLSSGQNNNQSNYKTTSENCTEGKLFESGDYTGWSAETGTYKYGKSRFPFDKLDLNSCPIPNPDLIVIEPPGDDGVLRSLIPKVVEGNNSIRIGKSLSGLFAQRVKYTFRVTNSNKIFRYSCAVLLQDPGDDHEKREKPYFMVRAYVGNFRIKNDKYFAGDPYFHTSGSTNYKPWDCEFIDFSRWVGKTVSVEYTVRNCVYDAHWAYAYIDGFCDETLKLDINIPDRICFSDPVIADGTASEMERDHFWSIQESDANWNRYGTEAMEWFNAQQAGKINLREFAEKHGLTLKANTYYRVKLAAKNGCVNWKEYTKLIYLYAPVADAGPDITLCCNNVMIMQVITPPPPPGGITLTFGYRIGLPGIPGNTYSWESDPPGFQSNEPQPSVYPGKTTRYILTVTDETGCKNKDTVFIFYLNSFDVSLTSEISEDGCETILSAKIIGGNCPGDDGNNKYSNEVSSLYSYQWNTGETTPSIKANPFVQTSYSVTVKSICDSSTKSLLVEPVQRFNGELAEIIVPDAFSPNGDGNNDVFQFIEFGTNAPSIGTGPAYNATEYQLTVFDRWGTGHVVSSGKSRLGFKNGDIQWDGKIDNVIVQQGVYSYILELKNCKYINWKNPNIYNPRYICVEWTSGIFGLFKRCKKYQLTQQLAPRVGVIKVVR